ncbi:hypothetical protein IA57_10270 [Mangrovimonas yunxiaonensis]|uniref:Dihydrolipoamide dehydrogenase n=1 Tax=Mangrovimonas yunxiaonensis TaxID=1197477 RepID=A0A084TJD9_9FLAO|nr:DUF2911 domain-containing protein [Mangrovimonas yunxiaonensis]KFB00825.1 hypothetical protein IA57_10270 [Mangrovimonas yunxiaonensis]GGH44202.1 hypothetical protein GCM10011364_16890 [Mangrovimonas yunxiaonensis]
MKKLLLLVALVAFTINAKAQIETPQPSPASKLEQKVGLTDVTLEYSRPGVRGRTIFGDLVPYGKLWRAGANKNTTVTFSDDVTIAGKTVSAGSYAIFITPSKTSWDVFFYTDTNNWGTPQNWDESKVAAKATVETHEVPFSVETFTIDVNQITNNGAALEFIWEKTYTAVPFSVPTGEKVSAAIDRVMNGPGANDYYAAAVYYLEEGKDINQAKQWIDKALSLVETPRFWQYRKQALIYAEAGDKKGAIEAAKKSLEGAKKAGNADYVKMNTDSLKAWGGL